MILLCRRVELPIVHTNSPPRDSVGGDQLIVLVRDYSHTAFLGNALHRTYPFTIRDGKDNACVQPFKYLFLDD